MVGWGAAIATAIGEKCCDAKYGAEFTAEGEDPAGEYFLSRPSSHTFSTAWNLMGRTCFLLLSNTVSGNFPILATKALIIWQLFHLSTTATQKQPSASSPSRVRAILRPSNNLSIVRTYSVIPDWAEWVCYWFLSWSQQILACKVNLHAICHQCLKEHFVLEISYAILGSDCNASS